MPVRIFLSTVSNEFLDYRDLLRADLTRHNTEVKVQEDFQDYGGTTLEKLDTYIKSCDAVVHLVGEMTGSFAQDPSTASILTRYPDIYDKLPVLRDDFAVAGISYTQWEAWLAIYHSRLLFIAEADPAAPRGPKYAASPESRAAQTRHLRMLRSIERYPGCTFTSPDNLAKHIAYGGILDLLAADIANTRPGVLVEPIVDTATMVFVDLMRLTCVAGSEGARMVNESRYPEFVDMTDLHLAEFGTHVTRVTAQIPAKAAQRCLDIERHMSFVLLRLRREAKLDRSWFEFLRLLADLAGRIVELIELLYPSLYSKKFEDAVVAVGRASSRPTDIANPEEFVRIRFAAQSLVLQQVEANSSSPISTIRDDVDRRLAVAYFAIDSALLKAILK